MNTEQKEILHKATTLIKAKKQQEASAILIPFIKKNPGSAQAWYLLGFSLDLLHKYVIIVACDTKL